jgi:glycosyltransferase involved in cell wall biosynthesis
MDELRAWRDADARRHILVTDPPAGIYPAMNIGVENTSAPIVLVLNGGDELLPGALRRACDSHYEHRWRWAYGGIEARDPDGHLVSRYRFSRYSRTRFRSGLEVIPHPSAYVARDLYRQVGLYREDLGSGADQEFFLRACMVAEPGQIPGLLAVFETGGVSSREGLVGRELSWHRMRVASRTAFAGNAGADWVVTALLVGHQACLWAIRKFRGLRSSSDDDAGPTVAS